jgi:hypothetical protein
MSWLDQITVCSAAYAYQGNLVCEDCASKISERLARGGVVDDDDSRSFPQGPYERGGGESDTAMYCNSGKSCLNAVAVTTRSRVGCPLGNPLTSEGAANVRETIRRLIAAPNKFDRLLGRLLHRVWGDYSTPENTFGRLHPRYVGQMGERLPKSLLDALKKYVARTPEKTADVRNEVYCDSENLYLLSSCGLSQLHGHRWGTSVDLLRAPVGDNGEFSVVEIAMISPQAAVNRPIEDLLRDAISEGAWD